MAVRAGAAAARQRALARAHEGGLGEDAGLRTERGGAPAWSGGSATGTDSPALERRDPMGAVASLDRSGDRSERTGSRRAPERRDSDGPTFDERRPGHRDAAPQGGRSARPCARGRGGPSARHGCAEARDGLTVPGKYLVFEERPPVVVVPLQREWTRIGRSLAADVRFDDATVSRRHALIVSQAEGVRVLDDRSLNGVYVNGEPRRVGAAHRRRRDPRRPPHAVLPGHGDGRRPASRARTAASPRSA